MLRAAQLSSFIRCATVAHPPPLQDLMLCAAQSRSFIRFATVAEYLQSMVIMPICELITNRAGHYTEPGGYLTLCLPRNQCGSMQYNHRQLTQISLHCSNSGWGNQGCPRPAATFRASIAPKCLPSNCRSMARGRLQTLRRVHFQDW